MQQEGEVTFRASIRVDGRVRVRVLVYDYG